MSVLVGVDSRCYADEVHRLVCGCVCLMYVTRGCVCGEVCFDFSLKVGGS